MTTTVLLVEDDEDARTSLTRSLVKAGYQVLAAGDPDEALRLVASGPFVNVGVTDVFLGGEETGGLRVLRELRKAGVEAPVIMITAFAALDNVKAALNEGAAYLLEKPFRASELLEVIGRVLTDPSVPIVHFVDQALSQVALTDKEQTIARYLLKGLTSSEIARLESNSDKTVRQHITRIYAKCGVSSRAEFFHYVFPC